MSTSALPAPREAVWDTLFRWHEGLAALLAARDARNLPQQLMQLLGELVQSDGPLELTVMPGHSAPFML